MTIWVWVVNILGWPVLHISISFLFLRLPARLFACDTWLTQVRRWELDGRLYRDWFAIRRWKSLLPDGAPWLGGMAKKKLLASDSANLSAFLLEARRAEWAHWSMLLCLPLFFLWNPPWACAVMAAYAISANLPCILAQRFNRILIARVLRARHRVALAHETN